MAKEMIEFHAIDGVILNGYINKGKSKNDKVLIEVHGMTSSCFKKRENVIANIVESIEVDSICFNTRGSEIMKYIKYNDGRKKIAGTAYEDIEECYSDIVGAIKFAIELGYTSIYLQGHSLGATKIVYTYEKMKNEKNPLLNNIKGLILLSLVDLPYIFKKYSDSKYLEYAEQKEMKNEIFELMPKDSFIHPISIKNFLKYTKYNEDINFVQYGMENSDFTILNHIDIPLFMRWGDNGELIEKDAKEQVEFMNHKIKNEKKDINYIEGANHTYSEKEVELADDIKKFLINSRFTIKVRQ